MPTASDKQHVNWGILGAGGIARAFAAGIANSEVARITAVGSRDQVKAAAFARDNGLPDATAHGSYDALLSDDHVDAIYIATPHPHHAEWAVRAARAGKHLLVEKPIAMNHAETMAVVDAARESGVFLMEAFKDRCHPQTHKLLELIRGGAIGEVRTVRAEFGWDAGDPAQHAEGRVFNAALGGGGILDVGCYAVAFVRLIAGVALDRDYADPTSVKAVGRVGETGADEWSSAVMLFENDIVAEVATAVRAGIENTARIVGSAGTIIVPDPWLNESKNPVDGRLIVVNGDGEQIYDIDAELTSYGYETEVASRAILAGKTQADAPAMTPGDSLGQMATLDAWRREIGLDYPCETPAGFAAPIGGRAAPAGDAPAMTYARVPGLDRDISRMVMGCDNQLTFPHAAVIFDAWLAAGGNAFDTAHIYGDGLQERLLGQWLTSRGVRDDVVLISKGGHTPDCTPEGIRRQLDESLERLQTGHADIYIMHRDNPEVPVGEFVDVLHDLASAGKFTVAGGSNWDLERFRAANAYAEKNGRRPLSLVSNNFSLAKMIHPVWDGCIASTTPAWRSFLESTGTPNFAWSSQARGYFVSRDAEGLSGGMHTHSDWDSPDNRVRRERAFELAGKHGVTAINIAAAYVLQQPFPSFALIGPRRLEELRTTLPALGVTLTASELAYLDLSS